VRKSYWTIVGSLAGVIAGGAVGYFVPPVAESLEFVGQLYLNVLRVIVVPLAIAVIVHGLGTLRNAAPPDARSPPALCTSV